MDKNTFSTLAAVIFALVLAACGGSETNSVSSPAAPVIKASVPTPAKKATTVTGGNGVVIHMYQALYGMAPSNALLVDYAFQADSDASTFVKNLTDRFATTSHADLAKLVLDNLGVTPTSVPAINSKGESEYGLLLDAVKQLFAAYPTMRGQVILNMTNLLTGLESDATYGGSATAYNVQSTANFSYSSNPANSVTTAVKPPPSPAVNVSLSQSKVTVGSSVTLTWSSTNATSCVGLDSMVAGAQATSGSKAIAPTAGGQFTYTISCDGAGGTAKNSVLLIVPLPVYPTSYQNAKSYPVNTFTFPGAAEGYGGDGPLAWGAGDFLNNGTLTVFTAKSNQSLWNPAMTLEVLLSDPKYLSDFEFWSVNANGVMTKITPMTMKGCLHARKAVVADFNQDGIPDILVACHGYDATPFPGEKNKLLLSNGPGKFTIRDVDEIGVNFNHGATAADVNSDGYPDIITAPSLAVYINQKNGTFAKDTTRIKSIDVNGPYVSIELVDTNYDGIPDILVGGHEWVGPSKILYGDASGQFGNTSVTIPEVLGRGVVLDFTVVGDNLFVTRSSDPNSSEGFYRNRTLQKISLSKFVSSVVLDVSDQWIAWWIPTTVDGLTYVTPWNNRLGKYLIE